MGLEQSTVSEVVDKAVSHRWSIPEFQRGFVWSRQKVRDLVDSLWRGYPVGSFLLWYPNDEQVEARVVTDGSEPAAWLVDGQQRTTALCVLLGRRPYWWQDGWNDLVDRHDIRFNVMAEEEPYFQLASAVMRKGQAPAWVSIRDVLNADDDDLSTIIAELLPKLSLPGGSFGKLWTKLDGVRKIREISLPIVTVALDLEDVTEIFSRLNSAGTKVTEADIALALAASQNPGWARSEFLPFLEQLDEAGFEIDPNLVFRSMVAVGLDRAVLRDVPRDYWSSKDMHSAWARTKKAWSQVVGYIEHRGVLSADVLPTKNALIPLVVLAAKHTDALGSGRPFRWLLEATRSGRYGGAAITAVQTDVRLIAEAASGEAAVDDLFSALTPWEPFTAESFLSDYRDRPLRLVLYLLMFDRGAQDWDSARQRLGFHGTELLERFNPQWHHIFPRGYLRTEKVADERWDLFTNIAVIGPAANISIRDKAPPEYLAEYDIGRDRLEQQLVLAEPSWLVASNYEEFLGSRSEALAAAANDMMASLGPGVRRPDDTT